MLEFVTTAYASETASSAAGGSSTLIMIVVMIAVFYFLLSRPENKRKKDAEAMRNSLKKGDYLTTIGGVYGRVVAITDRTVVIETSEDRVRVEFIKGAVGQIGTLEQQAAAQQKSGGLFGKKAAPAQKEETAVEAPAAEEAPAVAEKSSDAE